MPEIEPGSALCKANNLPSVAFLWFLFDFEMPVKLVFWMNLVQKEVFPAQRMCYTPTFPHYLVHISILTSHIWPIDLIMFHPVPFVSHSEFIVLLGSRAFSVRVTLIICRVVELPGQDSFLPQLVC